MKSIIPANHTILPPPYSLPSHNPLDLGQTFTHKSQEQNHMPLKHNKQKQTLDQL